MFTRRGIFSLFVAGLITGCFRGVPGDGAAACSTPSAWKSINEIHATDGGKRQVVFVCAAWDTRARLLRQKINDVWNRRANGYGRILTPRFDVVVVDITRSSPDDAHWAHPLLKNATRGSSALYLCEGKAGDPTCTDVSNGRTLRERLR